MTQPPDAYTAELREKHRAAPLTFFERLLREFFMNRDPDQTLRKWQTVIEENRWYTEDVIECMTTVLANPPENLVDIIQENGWVMLPRSDGSSYEAYHGLYLAWLQEQIERLGGFLA